MVLFTVAALWVGSGPLAVFLVVAGQTYDHLLKTDATKERVRRSLGNPWWKVEYPRPVMIKETEEFRRATKRNNGHEPFVWGTEETQDNEEAQVASCEIYENDGPYYELIRGEAYGMITALTLFLGGPYCLWDAIQERIRLSQLKFYLTFWFDENGRYVAYLKGNLLEDFNQEIIIKPDPYVQELTKKIDKSEKGFLAFNGEETNSLIPKYLNTENAEMLFEKDFAPRLFLFRDVFNGEEVVNVMRFSTDNKEYIYYSLRANGALYSGAKAHIRTESPYGIDEKIFRMSRNESIRSVAAK